MEKNKFWDTLILECDKPQRDIISAHISDMSCGIHDEEHKSSIYFVNPDKDFIGKIIKGISNTQDLKWERIENRDWNENWRPFFKTLNIDNRVKVVPSWSELNYSDEKLLIKIDPGMAFGTGHHETTHMMISVMLEILKKNMSVLDIGSGSGILSILASKLGAKNIKSIDNDEDTKGNFLKNMQLNNVVCDLNIMDCLELKDFEYDLILANINLKILEKLIPNIKKSGSCLILSGILNTDFSSLERVISLMDFNIEKIINKGEWGCLIVQT